MWAAADERVQATGAIGAFTTMREVVPQYTRVIMPLLNLVSESTLQRLAAEAADEAGFDIDDADALSAIRQVRSPVLIVHGTGDLMVPQWHGRSLHAAPGVSRFVSPYP